MLVEGVDDSVLSFCSILVIVVIWAMCSFLRNNILSISQLNPRLHRDSQFDVDRFRREVLQEQAAQPTAPPQPEEPTPVLSSAPTLTRSRQHSQLNCPICLINATLPIETNCGHVFCSICIIQYWRHLTSDILHSRMKCPMCRQEVNILLPLYSVSEERTYPEFASIRTDINSYNRRFSGAPRSYWDYLTEVPILLRHAINELFSINGIAIWYRLRVMFFLLLAFCYFISPLDIIPEAIFGIFGFFDDILIFLIIAIYISIIFRQYISNRH